VARIVVVIQCIFTLDYEIFGNGSGSLARHVYEPAERLSRIFEANDLRFVVFPEVAELEMIESVRADADITLVMDQVRRLREKGFEIGLHLHPWWYNGRRAGDAWILDYSEYNMCSLAPERLTGIIDRALTFLRRMLHESDFTPLSFRAGHLLFQPTALAARVLCSRGIRIDSSVFKGGLWAEHRQDYRPAMANGYYWRFDDDVNVSAPDGRLLEVPIHTDNVPFWALLTAKRIGLEQQSGSPAQVGQRLLSKLRRAPRMWRPLKFDYCAMTPTEMKQMIDKVVEKDRRDPERFRPLVAIGHTKDLIELDAVERILEYLHSKGIGVSTFAAAYEKCAVGDISLERRVG
jgi:hypothetical protein